MTPQSLSLSFRLPLAFHCLNNEGASGNVMEPRRITINEHEYDGISGEMVRRHVLENFVRLCGERGIPLTDQCRGLAPERSKETLKTWMVNNKVNPLTPGEYNNATTHLLQSCALSDLGGYLLPLDAKDNGLKGTLKRDSCFEFGWLITENPAIVEFTQQVAYRADPSNNNPFTQNMRVGTYGGVFRFDLGRVGVSDWAWIANGEADALSGKPDERKKRIAALLDALEQWLLSPSGARQAGWLQHQSDLREGVFCLSSSGPAPFVSPLTVDLRSSEEKRRDKNKQQAQKREAEVQEPEENDTPVYYNPDYRKSLQALAAKREEKRPGTLEAISFDGLAELTGAFDTVRERLNLTGQDGA